MNNTSLIAIIVIIILLVVGGYFLLARDGTDTLPTENNTPSENTSTPPTGSGETAPMTATINYTANGYEPNSVTIKKGGSVTWVNQSGGDMWVASASHPTHTLYPEKTEGDCLGSAFDACERMPNGESYTFTFNQVGSWNYHDHVNASKFGKVIVVE